MDVVHEVVEDLWVLIDLGYVSDSSTAPVLRHIEELVMDVVHEVVEDLWVLEDLGYVSVRSTARVLRHL